MKIKPSDIISLLSLVAGVCGILGALILTTTVSVQAQLHPGAPSVVPAWAIISSAFVGALGSLATGVVRILNSPAGAPATSVVQDAPIVTPNGAPTGAKNVTTTTTTPIIAPVVQSPQS